MLVKFFMIVITILLGLLDCYSQTLILSMDNQYLLDQNIWFKLKYTNKQGVDEFLNRFYGSSPSIKKILLDQNDIEVNEIFKIISGTSAYSLNPRPIWYFSAPLDMNYSMQENRLYTKSTQFINCSLAPGKYKLKIIYNKSQDTIITSNQISFEVIQSEAEEDIIIYNSLLDAIDAEKNWNNEECFQILKQIIMSDTKSAYFIQACEYMYNGEYMFNKFPQEYRPDELVDMLINKFGNLRVTYYAMQNIFAQHPDVFINSNTREKLLQSEIVDDIVDIANFYRINIQDGTYER